MPQQKTDSQVRLFQQVVLTAFLWAATFVATRGDWAHDLVDLPRRVALVAIGIGGFLPVVYVYAKSIRMQDEFNQRIHLVSLGVAFAITAAVSYAADLLQQAHFIREVPSGGVWALMVAIWFVSMLATARYYR